MSSGTKTKEEPQKTTTKVRTKPDKEELDAATNYLKKEFPGSVIKFLWNQENCYRFRINHFGTSEDGEIRITASIFVVATVTSQGVEIVIKDANPPSRN